MWHIQFISKSDVIIGSRLSKVCHNENHKRHRRNLMDAMLAMGIQGGSVLLKKPVKNCFQDINMTVNNGLFLVPNLHQEWPFLTF